MIITRNRVLIGLAILVLAAADFVSRVMVPRTEEVRSLKTTAVDPLPDVLTVDAVWQQFGRWLPTLAPPAGSAGDVDAPAPQLRLVGVFHEDGRSFALLGTEDGAGQPLLRAAVGDEVHGLRVTAIDRRSVTLEGRGGGLTLPLFKSAADAANAPRAKAPRAVHSSDSQSGTAPPAEGQLPVAPPVAGSPLPPGGQSQTPVQLAPGEQPKLPWDLPSDSGSAPEAEKRMPPGKSD